MLEIRHNPKNSHENEAFRRIATFLERFFREQNWNGLMIGNPVVEDYQEFQPDILLFTPTALLIIDLKDYKGEVSLPSEDKFLTDPWLLNDSVIIRGGNSLNPFDQIQKLRQRYKDILSEYSNRYPHLLEELHQGIDQKDHTKGLVLFTGPIQLSKNSHLPGSLRWFSISDEDSLLNKLRDFNDGFTYNENLGNFLKTIFKADAYRLDNKIITHTVTGLEDRLDLWPEQKECIAQVKLFLQSDDRLLLITGPEKSGKSYMISSITTISQDLKKTQVLPLVVNNRVANRLNGRRTGIRFGSIYSLIYGGEPLSENETTDEEGDDIDEDDSIHIIPIKVDRNISEDAVLIIDEAQLLSSSEHKTDLLRFGSGKLLADLFTFLKLKENSRKVIFIGDTNQISFGDEALSATHPEILQELTGSTVHVVKLIKKENDKSLSRLSQNMLLAKGIERDTYNNLVMKESEEVHFVNSEQAFNQAKNWIENGDSFAILAYSNEEVDRTNQYIRKNILKRVEPLSSGDLLVFNNNIRVINSDPLAKPIFLNNGILVRVVQVKPTIEETVYYKKRSQPVKLIFQNLTVSVLDDSSPVEILILSNFMNSLNAQLTREESTALRVLLNRRLQSLKKENPFEKSVAYDLMKNDVEWKQLSERPGDFNPEESEKLRKRVISKYKKLYNKAMRGLQHRTDPYAHAGLVRFGWSMTVHKALGEKWPYVIINSQMASNSRKNKAYFQWLYSGISRAEKEVLIVNWKELHPLAFAKFAEEEIPISSEPIQSKSAGTNFLISEPDLEYQTNYFKDFQFPKVIDYVFSINKLLSADGFNISKIITDKQWAVKIIGTDSAGSDFVVVVNYKKNGVPNKPRSEKSNPLIDKFLNSILNVPSPELTLPTDFRNEVYSKWIIGLRSKSWTIETIENLNWLDRITTRSEDAWCVFDVQYNSEDFISFVKPLKVSSKEAWSTVVTILKKVV